MNNEPTTVEKLRALPWSIASNAALAVYLQLTFFGSVYVLFLSSLGLSKSNIGFLLSLLPFTGVLSLFIAPTIARFGYKRTWLTFFALRTFITAFLLFTPWVVDHYGTQAAMAFITAVTLVYALVRTVGVTAGFPWIQEYVPNSVRGKYTATNNVFSTMFGFLAISMASYTLARTEGLTGYMLLLALGVTFGFISVALALPIPGGAPVKRSPEEPRQRRALRDTLRDSNMVRYLAGVGLYTLATVPLASFLPLYMQEQVGLTSAQVVLLQTGVMAGSLLSSYFWGWAADRYGGRPVTLYGLAFRALLPIMWAFIPRGVPAGLPVALAIAAVQGFADVSWQVGATRLLYVSVVPTAKRDDYLAIYWAWLGLAGGLSQLLGGRILDFSAQLGGGLAAGRLGSFAPLFALGLILPLVAIGVMRKIREDRTVGMGQFAGIFLRGNPFLALEAVVRFHLARDEDAAVKVTERLGSARSPLSVEELLEALDDPRFNVRFEAIIAVARTRPEERLINALAEVLHGPEPALSTVAAWALGRMGAPQAVEPLRQALGSKYRSVQAHSIRSLGVLGDREVVPLLLERLATETDVGMQLAYASALGRLQVTEATDRLLELLRTSPSRSSRQEMALDLARLAGDEHTFIQLMRQVRKEPGTALAQSVLGVKKRLESSRPADAELVAALDRAAAALAREDLTQGLVLLAQVLRRFSAAPLPPAPRQIVEECALQLTQQGARRLEYAALALHALQAN